MTIITIPKVDPIYNVVVSMENPQDVLLTDPVGAFVSTAFTIEWWMKANSQNTGTLLSYTLAGESSLLITNPGNINIYINTVQTTATGVSFADDDDWHYFTLTWNNSDGRLLLYKDAALVYVSILAKDTTIQPGGSLAIGQKQTAPGGGFTNPYAGKIGEVRIWDQARPLYFIQQDMIRDIYGNGSLPIWQLLSPATYLTNISAGVQTVDNIPVITLFGISLSPANNVIKSDDLGQTWSLVPSPAMDYVCMEGGANVWAIGTDQTVYLSEDSGNTWETPNTDVKLVQLSAVPGTAMGISPGMGVWRTTDMGVTWTQPNTNAQLLNIAVVDANVSWGAAPGNGLYKSGDGGAGWEAVEVNFAALMVAYSEGSLLVLTTGGELNCSTDNGSTWHTLLSDIPVAFISLAAYGNTLWGINNAYQLLASMFDTAMVLNWPLIEGYGCYGFDYSGNNNNGQLGGCTLEHDEQEWEISTLISAPKFIEGPASTFPGIISQVQQELKEEAAKPKPVVVAATEQPPAKPKPRAAKSKRPSPKPKKRK